MRTEVHMHAHCSFAWLERRLTRCRKREAGVVFRRPWDGAHWRQQKRGGAWVPGRQGSCGSGRARPLRMSTWEKSTRLRLVDCAQLVQAWRPTRARDVTPMLPSAPRAVPSRAWSSARLQHAPLAAVLRSMMHLQTTIQPPGRWTEAGAANGSKRLHVACKVELRHGG